MYLSANPSILLFLSEFLLKNFLLIMKYIFLLLSMFSNFLYNYKHCKCYDDKCMDFAVFMQRVLKYNLTEKLITCRIF